MAHKKRSEKKSSSGGVEILQNNCSVIEGMRNCFSFPGLGRFSK